MVSGADDVSVERKGDSSRWKAESGSADRQGDLLVDDRLRDGRIPHGGADRAIATVFMFVLGALGESAGGSLRRRLQREGRDPEELIRETMEQQREVAMQFPRLRKRAPFVDDSDYFSAPEKSFEFGLEAIFDGLDRQLKKGPAPGAS